MRNTFIHELARLAKKNKNIALIVGDLGYSVVEPFADEFPDRFINAGVAEQNMTGLAAGMASEGYHVFTYSIANFPTFRCAEQIRNDVAYHNLPVTIVAVGGGLAYGPLGYSHHAVQDYALLRTMPNMLIAAPGDPMEVRGCMKYLTNNPGPSYLRIGKAGEADIHESVPEVNPGEWLQIAGERKKTKKIILSTGATLPLAIKKYNEKESDYDGVYSMPLWGMDSKKIQTSLSENFEEITTLEDHLIDGGMGSWLMESLISSKNEISKIKIIGLDPIVCGTVGTQQTLNKIGGIS